MTGTNVSKLDAFKEAQHDVLTLVNGDNAKLRRKGLSMLRNRIDRRHAGAESAFAGVLKRVADELKEDVRLEKPPAMEGRALSMILIPTIQKIGEKAEKNVEDLADAKT